MVAGKVSEAKGLSEDVHHIVKSTNTKDSEFMTCNEVSRGMIVDVEVFDFCMPALIFHQLSGSIIVAMEWCSIKNRHIQAIKELLEKSNFLPSIMKSNVFSIAGQVCSVQLFSGYLEDHARTE
jgi:hypothetical protein